MKLLFDRKAIDVIKQYVQRQFSKLISNRLSIQELTFAREYRGLKNYKPAACVPALQLAKYNVSSDAFVVAIIIGVFTGATFGLILGKRYCEIVAPNLELRNEFVTC